MEFGQYAWLSCSKIKKPLENYPRALIYYQLKKN